MDVQNCVLSPRYLDARSLAYSRFVSRRWHAIVDRQPGNWEMLRRFRLMMSPDYVGWWRPMLLYSRLPDWELSRHFGVIQSFRTEEDDIADPAALHIIRDSGAGGDMLRCAIFTAPPLSKHCGELAVIGFYCQKRQHGGIRDGTYYTALITDIGEHHMEMGVGESICRDPEPHKKMMYTWMGWLEQHSGKRSLLSTPKHVGFREPTRERIVAAVTVWGQRQTGKVWSEEKRSLESPALKHKE